LETYAFASSTKRAEERIAKENGATWINIPMNPLPGKLNISKVGRALDLIKESKPPVLLHCLRGSDRTGIVMALYRVTVDNWGFDAAYREMDELGFNNTLFKNYKKELKQALGMKPLLKALGK
jgi:protein-tyrosine phosphatase